MRVTRCLLPLFVLLLPASARADDVAPCGPDRPPTVTFGSTDYGSDLSGDAVVGRALKFYVLDDALAIADAVQAAVVENDQRTLLPYRTGYDLDRPFSVTPQRPGQLVLSAEYTEDGLSRDGAYPPDCAQVVTKTVTIRQGRMLRPPNVKADDYGRGATFRLHASPASCTTDFDPSPIVISVRRASEHARWISAGTDDQCRGWRTEHTAGPLSLERVRYDDRQLIFTPAMPARRDAVRVFRYKIERAHVTSGETVASTLARSGKVIVKQRYRPAYRIYAWKPGLVVNDEYWNTCVKEGRETWVAGGNAYCIEPGYASASVEVT